MSALQTIVGYTVQNECEQTTLMRTGDVAGEWWTIARIARATGLSKPTVRKYVNVLVDSGHVKQIFYGGTSTAKYKWIGE